MGMNWIILALIPPFLWAFMNVLNKIIRKKHIDSTAGYFIISSLFLLVCVFALPFVWKDIPRSWITVAALGIGMAQALGGLLYFKALGLEEISRITPLMRFESIFVIIFAALLINEVLTTQRYIGFFLILIGGFIISMKEIKGVFHLSKAFYLMIGASFLWGTGDVIIKYIIGDAKILPFLLVNRTGAFLFALILLAIPHFRKEFIFHVKSLTKTSIGMIVVSESFALIGFFVFISALSIAPVSLVNVLLGFQPLFVLIIASIISYRMPHILEEPLTKKVLGLKIAGIILLIAGLVFIENGIH
jgi:drug/metabolite transporter (DMT)-like permease